jgi:hypothetical protein
MVEKREPSGFPTREQKEILELILRGSVMGEKYLKPFETVVSNLSLGLFLRISERHSKVVFGRIHLGRRTTAHNSGWEHIMTADTARGFECQRRWRYCNTVQDLLITFRRRFLMDALSLQERIPISLKGVLLQHVAFCFIFVYLWLLRHVHLACTPKVPAG